MLDALGHDLEAQRLGHGDDVRRDRARRGFVADGVDERLVDLERVDLEHLQV
ncbi:hypothetical protein D3C80_2159350 [compost metagenome]